MPLRTYRKVTFAIGAALVLFIVGAAIAVGASVRLASDAAWLAHGHDVQREFGALAATVNEAKADVRSFLLTGDSTYLRRYESKMNLVDRTVATLHALAGDDTLQERRLSALADMLRERRQALAQTVALRSEPTGQMLQNVGPILIRGEALSARIDSLVGVLDIAERQLLNERVQGETVSARVMVTVASLLALVAIVIAFALRRSIGRDLVGRARAEEALRASEAKFAGILSVGSDAIITVDQSQKILHFNHGAVEVFGYAEAEVRGQTLELLLPQRYREGHRGHVEGFARSADTARRMGERRPVFGRRKSGEEFPVDVSISKLATPEGFIFTAVLRDATERVRAQHHEHALATAGAALAETLDYEQTLTVVATLAVPAVGVWSILDIVEESEAGVRTPRRLVSHHPDRAIDDALREWEASPFDWDSPERVIDVLRTGVAEVVPDAQGEWLEGHVASANQAAIARRMDMHSLIFVPLVAGERVNGVLTIGSAPDRTFDEHDLALARALADRAAKAIDNARLLRRAQHATAARDHVLGIVSHDLRNPLSAVSMLARRIVNEPLDDATERKTLGNNILSSVEWMHRLMRDLLDMASIEAGRLSVELGAESAAGIIDSAIAMFAARAEAQSVTLRGEIAEGVPVVEADAARVIQVLGNLIGNALKFTPAGGSITVGAHPSGEHLVVWVRDTGEGIPSGEIPRVFDRFWQARRRSEMRGWGLGLAIAHGIVAAHGGRIWVESAVGQGTTFFFTIRASSPLGA